MKNKVMFLILLCTVRVLGQQEPQYTQYSYNPSMINPVYAGSLGYGCLYGLYSSQWIRLVGPPKMNNVSIHQPLTNKRLGCNIIHDEIRPSTTMNLVIDFSYTIDFDNDRRLAFGIKKRGYLLNIDLAKLNKYNPTDKTCENNIMNQFLPNIGAGLFYYNNSSYIGLSFPMILQTNVYDVFAYSDANSYQHFYLMAGRVFELSSTIKCKPALESKVTLGASLQVDVASGLMFNEKFTLGLAYRWNTPLSGLITFNINDHSSIGYGYDKETT